MPEEANKNKPLEEKSASNNKNKTSSKGGFMNAVQALVLPTSDSTTLDSTDMDDFKKMIKMQNPVL